MSRAPRAGVPGTASTGAAAPWGRRILGAVNLTMDGQEGARKMHLVRPKKTVPVHYDDHGVCKSPLEEFAREVKTAGQEQDVVDQPRVHACGFAPVQR